MSLLAHQLRTEQLIFWRSREAAVFIFVFPPMLFLLLGAVYDGRIDGVPAVDRLLVGNLDLVLDVRDVDHGPTVLPHSDLRSGGTRAPDPCGDPQHGARRHPAARGKAAVEPRAGRRLGARAQHRRGRVRAA